MHKNQLAYDCSVIKPITRIDFGVLGNDEIRKRSVLTEEPNGIEYPELYDKLEPKKGGLLDSRMGGSNNYVCATCGLDAKYCDGHEAHIELAKHVFHIGYIENLKLILQCVCLGCSNLLIPKDESKLETILRIKNKKNRLHALADLAKKQKACLRKNQGCGIPTTDIKHELKRKTSEIRIYSETIETNDDKVKSKKRMVLQPDLIATILDRVSEEDLKIMGIYSENFIPSDMIHKALLVPPIHVRPSLRGFFSNGSSSEDSLTHKLGNIIKANIRVRQQIESQSTAQSAKTQKDFLDYQVACYFDEDAIIQKNDQKGLQLIPLVDRYKGKTGRIRGNLMGKRGDFNARTVITSDPTISMNEVGVPVKIAMNLTFPEIVTPHNIEKLTGLVRKGTDKYPGANFVFKQRSIMSGGTIKPIYLKFSKEEINLQYGDVVERHLQDGDIVLLNRQPTLHKQSMMGHKIKVINDPSLMTFRLSVSITPPYNAD
jgi:DNA-directed RNA polymerase II subunit RPB1